MIIATIPARTTSGSPDHPATTVTLIRPVCQFRRIRRHQNKNRIDEYLRSNQRVCSINCLDAPLTAGDASES